MGEETKTSFCANASCFELNPLPCPLRAPPMAALQFLSKYRETGLLLFRASLGLIFIILIAPILWSGQGSWEHFGSAIRHLDFHSHYKFLGFVSVFIGCTLGVLIIPALFFLIVLLFPL